MTEAQAREALVEAGKRLTSEGLVARSWGNVSVRLDDHTMAITPSGILWNDVIPGMISLVNLETGDWTGQWKPSGERKVHREIYRSRPDVTAVVHTHQSAASVWATARVSVPTKLGLIPCAPYALPSTKALTTATVKALGEGPAVLMANHGVFAVGDGLDEAFNRVSTLERHCSDLVVSRSPELPGPLDTPWDSSWLLQTPGRDGLWHSLAPFTQMWSERGQGLPAVLDDLAQMIGVRVRCATREPEDAPGSGALLVTNRGAFVWGADAEALAMVIEKTARAVIGAEVLGGARKFPAWEALLMHWVYQSSYGKRGRRST